MKTEPIKPAHGWGVFLNGKFVDAFQEHSDAQSYVNWWNYDRGTAKVVRITYLPTADYRRLKRMEKEALKCK
jgi:hypothetical protein